MVCCKPLDTTAGLPSDNDLMSRVRAGETEVLGILFERYRVPLRRFFLRFTGNHSLSDDLVQDVFLRIMKYRHTFGGGSEFAAWIYQIARNVNVQQFRKRKPEVCLEDAPLESVADSGPLPDEVLSRRHDLHLLNRALARLPQEKRELLELSRIRQIKYRHIAERLGCDVGTVKVRVLRATREVENAFFKSMEIRRQARSPLGHA